MAMLASYAGYSALTKQQSFFFWGRCKYLWRRYK